MNTIGNKRDNRALGAISISLLAVAFFIGAYSIFICNVPAAVIYFVVVVVGYFFNVYYYCRKCPHILDNSCRFVVFGKIACLFPKNRIGERYSVSDYVIIWFPRLFMFFFPRPWLDNQMALFVVFWVIVLLALFLWFVYVCRTCRNEKCPFRKMAAPQKWSTRNPQNV